MAKIDIKKNFGGSVKILRNQLGLSQEQLAERADLHRTYVSDVERGARNVSLESIEKLARALEISVSTLFLKGERPGPARTQSQSPLRDELVDILFVEDNPADAELAMHALKRARISNRIVVVHDGEEALDFLFCRGGFSHRTQADRPRLILLDLNLPKIDGLEVLRQVRANPKTRDIPVVILTASDRDWDFAEVRRLGVQSCIVKPVDFKNFSAVTPQLDLQWALVKAAPV